MSGATLPALPARAGNLVRAASGEIILGIAATTGSVRARERMRVRQGATQPQSVQIGELDLPGRAAGWHAFSFHVRLLAALPSCRSEQLASPAPFEEGLDALCSGVKQD